MTTFAAGDRVTTHSGNLVGTIYEIAETEHGTVVCLEWDDEAGPQEDEVTPDMIRHAG